MTERTHYVELGIAENATLAEIRTAYRRLVLLYHPDRSGDKGTTERFMRISEAYRALSEEKTRTEYDAGLKYRRDRAEQMKAKPPPSQTPPPREKERARTVGDEAAKLQQAAGLFASGRYEQAESLLKAVLRASPNVALAYAILGDIYRQRGDIRTALTQYSYAVQFSPNNSGYQRRYEELLQQSSKVTKHGYVEPKDPTAAPIAISAVLIALMAIVVSVSKDRPLFPGFDIVNTFSFTFVLLSFLAGISVGAAASISGLVDRLRSLMVGASGKVSPFFVLSILGVGSLWMAALTYFATGLWKDAFTYSASRIFGAVCLVTIVFTLCAWMSGVTSPIQAILWCGSLVWVGALCGWAIADGFR